MSFLVDSFGARLGGLRRRPLASPPEQPQLLWSTSHETAASVWFGWPTGPNGWDSGDVTRAQSNEQAHTGTFSAKATIDTTDTTQAHGVRLAHAGHAFPNELLPDTAYYSNWFYFPQQVNYNVVGASFLNGVQWKDDGPHGGQSLLYFLSMGNRAGGEMYWRLASRVDGVAEQDAVIDVPIGQWFQVETLYTWSQTNGELRTWQNGVELWNLTGILTQRSTPAQMLATPKGRQYSVNNYGRQSSPAINSIYIDDAAISSNRLWGIWP